MKDNRNVISLFSGAMGLDIGLQQAGMNIVIGQDVDFDCATTARTNGHNIICGDIRIITPQRVLSRAHMKVGEPFLICGGPPCQPFSTAGKRLGINDPRGSLFMDFIRMIEYIKPRFFLMENVKGLISAPLRTKDNKIIKDKKVIDVVLAEFKKLGYKTVYGILDAVNYGVPQFRERLIIIGSRDNEDIFLPIPTHFHRHQIPDYRWRTLNSAISDIQDNPGDFVEFSQARLKYLKMLKPGQNWKNLPERYIKAAMGGAYESGGGKVGFYRRLDWAQPSPTLVTSPVQKATMMCHPTEDRPLSIKEYARIQQFPDDWKLTGTLSSQYKQIGNAVPVGLAMAIGQAIMATANGDAVIKTKRLRGTSTHSLIENAIGGTVKHV